MLCLISEKDNTLGNVQLSLYSESKIFNWYMYELDVYDLWPFDFVVVFLSKFQGWGLDQTTLSLSVSVFLFLSPYYLGLIRWEERVFWWMGRIKDEGEIIWRWRFDWWVYCKWRPVRRGVLAWLICRYCRGLATALL